MLSFILSNLATIIIGALVLAVITLVTVKLISDNKKSDGCTCGCSGCPSAKQCAQTK